MAISTCRECKADVSTEAATCPHCGVPSPAPAKAKFNGCAIAVVAILAIGLVGALFDLMTPKQSAVQSNTPPDTHAGLDQQAAADPPPTPEQEERQAIIRMATMAAELVHRNLRNPDSFKLHSVLVTEKGAVCYEYRAQNGFGGMNLEHGVVDQKRSVFTIEGQEDFEPAWNRACRNKEGDDITSEVKQLLSSVAEKE